MATYYVSATGNDSNAGTQAAPWKTIAKVNNFTTATSSAHVAGDQILFKAGETFYGALTPQKNGTAANRIVFGRYGTGANPAISGFKTASGWLRDGLTDVYYCSITANITLETVTVNDNLQIPCRWPRTGWRTMSSASGSNTSATWSFTDTGLSGQPNFIGAEAVIKTYAWIVNPYPITGQTSSTLSGTKQTEYHDIVQNGYGYFVQKAKGILNLSSSLLGDWWQDKTNNLLYMKFPNNDPGNYTVRYSDVEDVVTLTSRSYITFNGVDIEGGNRMGIFLNHPSANNNLRFYNLAIRHMGQYAVWGYGGSFWDFQDVQFTDCRTGGFFSEWSSCSDTSLLRVNTLRIAQHGGSSGSRGDQKHRAIAIKGDRINITNCKVIQSGYNGICFFGNDILIENNYVDTFCTLKDDGGGIYTYVGDGGNGKPANTNRVVRKNIVINGADSKAGTPNNYSGTNGIYIDDKSQGILIEQNTIGWIPGIGIFTHRSLNILVRNNTIFCPTVGHPVYFLGHPDQSDWDIAGMELSGNKILNGRTDPGMVYLNGRTTSQFTSFGTASNNRYFAPYVATTYAFFRTSTAYEANKTNRTLAQWRTTTGQDSAASGTVTHATQMTAGNPNTDFKLFYNDSLTTISKDLGATSYKDLNGQTWEGVVQIGPFESLLLIRSGTYTPPTEPVVQSYVVKGRKPRKT
jgi:hypothetical protein